MADFTIQCPPIIARSGVDAADNSGAAPIVTARKLSSSPSHAYRIDPTFNHLEIIPFADADGRQAVMELWGQRHNGDFIYIGKTGTLTAGKQLAEDGTYYVDTATIAEEFWPTDIQVIDGGAADRMARFYMDAIGLYKIIFFFPTVTSGTWGVKLSGF